jgi:hypothetical protein
METPMNFHYHFVGYSTPEMQDKVLDDATKLLGQANASWPNEIFASVCKQG